ncbi:alpha-2-macroglobulin-like protein 1 isoform X1 [Periophthalmus magnuspinnatus]|uniref:alpha-2-macroglobulin-like protein 1 isoform X1 n=1 Tax=Periophthalmus magnuspinnatus TaxID=409849 RepID=UPI00243636B1|nr:alpha-2-macroglobulin-like protein 1 isoform X1 [Periophthalmus magnuspinnatus]
MGRPGIQMQTWGLFVTVVCLYLGQAMAGPHYMVAIPAILESGAQVKFCASLMKPNESLTMTVTLRSPDLNTTLFQKESDEDFHNCHHFLAPLVTHEQVQDFQVEVRGKTFYSREVRRVLIKISRPVSFIQTDKPLYLPGQTVHFRLVTLDTKLRPTCRNYDIIELEDPNSNRIGQWVNYTADSKILQLSYSLNPEAKEGTYQITVSSGEDKIVHPFKVEQYVLPKFDVKLTSMETVSIAQEEITVEACAKYTYGQPVPGILKMDACRPINRYLYGYHDNPDALPEVTAPCHTENKPADKNGCATFTFPMSTFTKLDQKAVQDKIEVVVKMEEEGTGTTYTQHKEISISYVIGKLSFFDTPKVYEKDTTIQGKVKAVRFDDQPMANTDLYLFEGERWSSRHLQNLTTDGNGVATFSLDTSIYRGDIHLHITTTPVLEYPGYRVPFYEAGDISLSMALESTPDTKTVSSLEVKRNSETLSCDTEEEITINYSVVKEDKGPMDVIYLVLARDGIVMQGRKRIVVSKDAVTEDSFSFKLQITAELAPEFTVVAYAVLPSSFVIAHSAGFQTEKCFSHKVEVEFTPSQGVPGEDASLRVTGHSSSLCGISAIDQSVLIQEPGKYLKPEMIYNLLPGNRYVPYQARDPTECLQVRPKRSIWPYPGNKDDPFTVFQNIGLKMATNLMIRVPDCLSYLGREYHFGSHYRYEFEVARMEDRGVAMAAPGVGFGGAAPPPLPAIETVRTFFPETWIWNLVEIGPSGKVDMAVKIPDTITTWVTEAFCLSPQGFGLAPRKEFTVFQPFFLQLSLPYSIIRGESFQLKATVFNYLTSCMMVAVTPAQSEDYTLTPVPGVDYTFCLCGNERKTVSWTVDATALGSMNVTVRAEAVASQASCDNEIVLVPERGRIDVVTRPLIVKAEGIEMMKSHNLLICPKEQTLIEQIQVQLPENVIVGSARAAVSVLGDILGRAMKNLDGLLQMPYGCGEQNMALLAPNIYIMEYLKITNQLTSELQEKATHYLTSGYQRQLNYKHSNGAYSTFGAPGSENTWLTAFVLRSFVKAKNFIYIDPANIQDAKTWLESTQMPNGCFALAGKLFHNRMKGGVSDEVTLTAYITAAFLEMGVPVDDPVVGQALTCLKSSMSDLSNTYTTALMAYVFTLAKDATTRDQLLQHLDSVGHRDGGFLHWSQKSDETSASLSVEISSYVLLAKLSWAPNKQDLGYASPIVRWLTKQQNYYGGYSSTQDTVVTLQALALYSALVYSPEGQSTVTVQSPSGQLTFEVNQNNKLLYQEKILKDMTGTYTVEVKGNTCAAIQVSVKYNVPPPDEKSTFKVEVIPEADCDSNILRPRVNLKIKSSYNGEQNSTNMVILDIKVLSGFTVDSESLKALKKSLLVERVEQDKDHIMVYLTELLKNMPINHELLLIQELPVHNLKPAVVRLYDYYQTSDKDETEYIFPCV